MSKKVTEIGIYYKCSNYVCHLFYRFEEILDNMCFVLSRGATLLCLHFLFDFFLFVLFCLTLELLGYICDLRGFEIYTRWV